MAACGSNAVSSGVTWSSQFGIQCVAEGVTHQDEGETVTLRKIPGKKRRWGNARMRFCATEIISPRRWRAAGDRR